MIGTVADIKTIDSDWVRDNYITVEFCKFVYEYSGVVSRTKTDFKDIMFSSDDISVFDVVGESDISWSLTMYVSHQQMWLYKFQEKLREKRLKAVREALVMPRLPAPPPPAPAPRRTRLNPGNGEEQAQAVTDNEEQVLPSEEDVPTNPYPVSKSLWTTNSMSAKSKYDCGLTPAGRMFYVTMKKALKGVDNSEWADVWEQFWADRKLVDAPTKKRKRNPASETRSDECFADGFVMDDLSDDEGEIDITQLEQV